MKNQKKIANIYYTIFSDSKRCIISIGHEKLWFGDTTKIVYTKLDKLSFYSGTYLKIVSHNTTAKLKVYVLCFK